MPAIATRPNPLAARTATASRGVVPLRGETQAAFAERYHNAMRRTIPNTDRRNGAMLQAWRQSGQGHDVESAAESKFANDGFVYVPNVPVFSEHTTRDGKGGVAIYDRRALAAIVDRCNERILDTGDFPPLTEGHTPTAEEQNAGRSMPAVLGYAGPFRLGLIGNRNPRWAIFADEWHHRDCVDKLRKMQRRSPEVWLEERMEDRFLDPIAALGAETPRLDLGSARYGRRADGRVVEKYTATLPGAATSFVPGAVPGKTDRKDRYKGQGMISPEDLDQIVEAILQTQPMQWVVQQMQTGPTPADQPPDAAPPGPPDAAGAAPPVPPPAALPAAPAASTAPPEPDGDEGAEGYEPDDEDRDQFRRYMAGECDDDEMKQYRAGRLSRWKHNRRKKYAADGSVAGDETSGASGDVADPALMRLSRRADAARYSRLESEVAELRQKVKTAEREREMTDRYSRVSEARQTSAFDERKLQPFVDPAKYSREAFDQALDLATSSAEKIPVGVGLHIPRLVGDGPQSDKDRAARELSDRAKNIATRYAKDGKHISYDAALAEARKEAAASA